ncbi:GTPase HflX [Hutsoniella sourekii]|uniref:GTPase HflX n=1 Tax=Hutsoniella sourekii TaxID=87650 RepID=UPI0004B54B0B|nr:GTPase HflX [Hutsoniella sourekii]
MKPDLIATQTDQEKVILVGVQTEAYSDERFQDLMEELASLTRTAQGDPLASFTQKMPRLNQKTAIGRGKLEEIAQAVDRLEVDLVVFFNDLTPSMNRELEEGLGCRVIDRVQLILDIFAMRAKSRAGKLQVELAQHQYLLPRIMGKGLQLSRLGGGIGTRGPGETQLETDRRHIRRRIHKLEEELAKLASHRQRTRDRRQASDSFQIGLVGYTNAGKSTLIQRLTDSQTYVQDQLFATLDPLTRQMTIKGHEAFTITDTVGFIEDFPTDLIHAFKSTLEEIEGVDLLLHVIDASHPARTMHEETVMTLLKDLDMDDIPILHVYNKRDRVGDHFEGVLQPNIVISAYDDQDLEALKERIWDLCLDQAQFYQVQVPSSDGQTIAYYQNHSFVLDIQYQEAGDYYTIKGYQKITRD